MARTKAEPLQLTRDLVILLRDLDVDGGRIEAGDIVVEVHGVRPKKDAQVTTLPFNPPDEDAKKAALDRIMYAAGAPRPTRR